MKKTLAFDKRTFLIPLTLIVGLFFWFSADVQSQTGGDDKPNAVPRLSGSLAAQDSGGQSAAPAQQETTISIQDLIARAEANDTWAMMVLATLYSSNTNAVKQNFGTALQWFQKAADAGVAEAFVNLGNAYEVGLGTAPDIKKAVDNYQKAADMGQAQADFKLATLYLNGLDLTRDIPKGMEYLNKAVAGNFNNAIMLEGAILYSGLFEQPRDLTKAKDSFLKAANQGNPAAMLRLAAMAIAGEGMEANKNEGLKWYLLAQEFGATAQEIQTTVDGLKASFTAAQIAALEKETKEWADKLRAEAANIAAANAAAARAAAEVPQ
ncbi:MAG: sel1 repeat family protein [Deltaproteobacteria bacterium]|jgi:TPR repeat protein|nr:sel1 repeat family protein [Deltaproteobacteria bacterium]